MHAPTHLFSVHTLWPLPRCPLICNRVCTTVVEALSTNSWRLTLPLPSSASQNTRNVYVFAGCGYRVRECLWPPQSVLTTAARSRHPPLIASVVLHVDDAAVFCSLHRRDVELEALGEVCERNPATAARGAAYDDNNVPLRDHARKWTTDHATAGARACVDPRRFECSDDGVQFGVCAERMPLCPYCRVPVQQWMHARVV